VKITVCVDIMRMSPTSPLESVVSAALPIAITPL
jgi:hypothetical protein